MGPAIGPAICAAICGPQECLMFACGGGGAVFGCRAEKKRRLVVSRGRLHHGPWASRSRHVRTAVLNARDHRLRHHRKGNRADGHAGQRAPYHRLESARKERSYAAGRNRTLVHRARNSYETFQQRITLSTPRNLLRLGHGHLRDQRSVVFGALEGGGDNCVTQLVTSHPLDVTHLKPELERLRTQLFHGYSPLLGGLQQLKIHGVVLVHRPVIQIDRGIALFVHV
mmetsp:Transcript_89687/g.205018  ORF Transcript_89687/g.205018 Transcript_89687/m.205018 type:complete len:226 (+) Transcript_89687:383-1060(+)